MPKVLVGLGGDALVWHSRAIMTDRSMFRRLILCADDYGISPGVNRAIRELIARGRLNATSVMVVGPAPCGIASGYWISAIYNSIR